MQKPSIILLAGKWDTTAIVYNFLQQRFCVVRVIVEDSVSRKEFLKKRAKKLGWLTVGGQVLFQLLIAKPQRWLSTNRIREIIQSEQLDTNEIPVEKLLPVSSVNAPETIAALQQLAPAVVVVHGTRIIGKKVLQQVNCPFINIHAGITPRYRGSHGAYWALANNDKENCGVTVHFIDAGIDTGNVLAQTTIRHTSKDNFVTYPYLQLAEGLKLLEGVIRKMEKREESCIMPNLDSALWHHPTLWGYCWKWITKGIR